VEQRHLPPPRDNKSRKVVAEIKAAGVSAHFVHADIS
jgi:hypothetical protein